MISVQVIREHRHQPDIAVVEFPRLSEQLVQCQPNACVVPVELPNKFENFVNRALGEDIMNEMSDKKFRNRPLLLLTRCAFRGIALTRKGSIGVCQIVR